MPSYTGSAAGETLTGSAGADTLTGLGGDDTYIVDHIGDVIVEEAVTGSGIDTIRNAVLDYLGIYSLQWWANVENLQYTGSAAAILKGNTLDNSIRANAAVGVDDALYGDAGDDSLFGFGGLDVLVGGSGDDDLDGGAGADTMVGGTGNDRYIINSLADRAFDYAESGFDTIVSAVAKNLRLPWARQIEGLLYNGTTAAELHGNARDNLVESIAASNDTLYGYAGNDTLDGGDGTDSMLGGSGDDLYRVSTLDVVTELAGEGIDTLVGLQTSLSIAAYATTVENLFYTGPNAKSLAGNGLDNLIGGGAGADTVTGGQGNDTLLGGAGADSLSGGNGDDLFYGGGLDGYSMGQAFLNDTFADTLAGGPGNDRYLIDSPLDAIVETATGGTLDVVISAIDNAITLYAGVEALVLQEGTDAWLARGGTGNDILVGNEADNSIAGGSGNDTLAGYIDVPNVLHPQSDVLDAGAGDDVLVAFAYGNAFTAARELTLLGGSGADTYILGMDAGSYGGMDTGGIDTAIMVASGSVENIEGIENIVLYGADAGIDLAARTAIQRVYAAAYGGATYTGSIGNAYDATGNALANQIVGNALDNLLVGVEGNDTITGGFGDDTLEGGDGTDNLTGGAGDDHYYADTGDVIVEAADSGYDVLHSLTITSLSGIANVEGLHYMGANAVSLALGANNTTPDFLVGGSANDTVTGYGGNDTLGGDAGNDTLLGGADFDRVYGDAGNDSLDGGTGDDTLDGGNDADRLVGQLGDDVFYGGAGNDTVDGGGNWDWTDAGDGDDEASGGDGNDTVYGGAGNDTLYGDNQNDEIAGDAGNDVIVPGAISISSVFGTQGDRLWGDVRYGDGGGADIFYFDNLTTDNGVVEVGAGSGDFEFVAGSSILDFEQGMDVIAIAAGFVGNGDATINNPVVKNTAGGTFAAGSELVLVRANVDEVFADSATAFFNQIDPVKVIAAIGSASANMAVNSTRLLVVDDGFHSAVFLHQSNDGNAQVTADELFLIAVVNGQTGLAATDFLFAT